MLRQVRVSETLRRTPEHRRRECRQGIPSSLSAGTISWTGCDGGYGSRGFIGIIFLVGFPSGQLSDQFFLGFFVCVIGCISAAFGSNYSKLKMSAAGNWEQVIGAFFFGGLFTSPILLFVPIKAGLVPMDWLYMVSLAVFCSAFCYVIYFSLVAKIGPTKSISVEFLVTVVAVLIGAFYLNEAISLIQLFGAVLVIIGSILILDLLSFSKKGSL